MPLTIASQFNSGLGAIGLGYDTVRDEVSVYGGGTTVSRFTVAGVAAGTYDSPGENADDFDLDGVPAAFTMNGVTVPAGSMLAFNGESGVLEIYAVDPVTGAVIATLTTGYGASHVVGGGYNYSTGTFFVVQDRQAGTAVDNQVAEIDPQTGAVIETFNTDTAADPFTVNYGDLAIHPATGNLWIVSSDENSIQEMTPDGAIVALHALPAGVGSLSGIAFNPDVPGEVFVVSTSGTVFRLSGVPVPENEDPNAVDDGPFATDYETDIRFEIDQLLGNDTDPEGDFLTIQSVQDAVGGTVGLDAEGRPVFTPTDGYSGPASFTYTVSDGNGNTDTATVSITVGSPPPPDNEAPVASADAYSVDEDGSLTVPAPGILGNDSDPDADQLTAALVAGPSNGSLTLNSDGSFTYTPDAGFKGTDSFTYRASDGSLQSGETIVTITVDPVNDGPVAGDDSGFVTSQDTPITFNSATLLANDTDADGDALEIESVQDAVGGTVALDGSGRPVFTPTSGYSGPASFTYTVSDGNGGSDTATVSLTVQSGDDVTIRGTPGDDVIRDTPGNDVIDALGGNDLIYGGAGNDVIRGGDGTDTVSYQNYYTGGVTVDLSLAGPQDTGIAGFDSFESIENLVGSRADDTLRGDDNNNRIQGATGNDTIFGAGGADELQGNGGNDVLDGGAGADTLAGGDGNDRFVFTSADGDLVKDWQSGEVVDISAIGGDFQLRHQYNRTFVTFDTDNDGQYDDGQITFYGTLNESDFFTGDPGTVLI